MIVAFIGSDLKVIQLDGSDQVFEQGSAAQSGLTSLPKTATVSQILFRTQNGFEFQSITFAG